MLPGEEARLLAYCDAQRLTVLKTFVVLAIEAATRRGEIANLNWKDLDLSSRLATLHETKNGTSRLVPLSTRAMAALLSGRRGGSVSSLSLLKYLPRLRSAAYLKKELKANFCSCCWTINE